MQEIESIKAALDVLKQARIDTMEYRPVYEKLLRVTRYLEKALDSAMAEYFTA